MVNSNLIVDENVHKENRIIDILFISEFFNLYLISEVSKTSNEKYTKSNNITAFNRGDVCPTWEDCFL